MPPKVGSKKRSMRVPRKGTKKVSVPKRSFSIMNVHSFTRFASKTIGTGLVLSNSGTNILDYSSVGITYTLDSCVNWGEFGALFDLYKIHKVDLYITLQNPNPDNTQSSVAITQSWFPKLWYFNDDDESAAPSLSQFKERQGVKYRILMPNRTIRITCYPKIQTMTYRTLTSTGYQSVRPNWIDANVDYNVPHYGTKLCLDMNEQTNTGYTTNVKVEAKYTLMFKNPQ